MILRMRILIFWAMLVLPTHQVIAQSQATTGNIVGTVRDMEGARVPSVTVSATDQATGSKLVTASGPDGVFVFLLLPPGNYSIESFAVRGFGSSRIENVTVTVGAQLNLEVMLHPEVPEHRVNVTMSAAGLETTKTSLSSTIDRQSIDRLPVNGRNFLDFAKITPEVLVDQSRPGDLVVGGQRGSFSSLQVDGTSSDNTFFGQSIGRVGIGRSPFQFSIDTVNEFQIIQNGFSAEYGRSAASVINVVTRSGTNKYAGSFFEYFRDESLNALSPAVRSLGRPKPSGQINQFGGTLSGPIRRDRVLFFAGYEGQRADVPNVISLPSLQSAPANVQAFLGPKITSYKVGGQQDTVLFKLDLINLHNNRISVRFNQQNFTGKNLEGPGSLASLEHTGDSNVITSGLIANVTTAFNAKRFNEFRFQFLLDKEPGLANSSDPEVVLTTPNGNLLFGGNSQNPRETTITRYQFVDNFTRQMRNHLIKFGADLLFDREFSLLPRFFGGSFSFPSYGALSSQLSNRTGQFASRYQQSFAGTDTTGPIRRFNNYEFGFFVQDEWRVNPKLTFTLGLRYDYQEIQKPRVLNPDPQLLAAGLDTSFRPIDTNNFAPRLGLAYSLSKRSVIRGGFGMFFARTPGILTAGAHSQNGIQIVAISINCGSTPSPPVQCPIYPEIYSGLPMGTPTSIASLFLFDRNYKQPFTYQARLQYEHEVQRDLTVSIRYSLFRGDDLTRTRNANLGVPVNFPVAILSGNVPTGESLVFLQYKDHPITSYDRIELFESSANSFYQGLTFTMERTFDRHFMVNASYTLSKAKDDKPSQVSVTVGSEDTTLTDLYSRSDFDIRHRLIVTSDYQFGKIASSHKLLNVILNDYALSGIFTAQSGFPYSAFVQNDPNNDGISNNDLVPGTRRNQYAAPARYICDVRFGKRFHLGEERHLFAFMEGFNVFNRSNIFAANNLRYVFSRAQGRSPAQLSPLPAFGTPSGYVSAQPFNQGNSSYNRELQLGLKLEF